MAYTTNNPPAAITLKGGIQRSYTSMLLNYEINNDEDLFGVVIWYRKSSDPKSSATKILHQYANTTQILVEGLTQGEEYVVSVALIDEFISNDQELLDAQYTAETSTLLNIQEYTVSTVTIPSFVSVRNVFTDSKKLWIPNTTLEVILSGSAGTVEIQLRKTGQDWVIYYKGDFVEVLNLPVAEGIYDIKLIASNQFYNATSEILPEVIYPSQIVVEKATLDPIEVINSIQADQLDIDQQVFELTSDYASFRDGLERRLIFGEALINASVYVDPDNGTIVNRAYQYTDDSYSQVQVLLNGVEGRIDIQAGVIKASEDRITAAESTISVHSDQINLKTSTTEVEALISTALSSLIPAYSWQFNTGDEGFTNEVSWNALGYLVSAAGTKIATPSISFSAEDNVVYRIAVRKHVGGTWAGVIYFNTTGTIPVPSPSAENTWEVVSIDASGTAGYTGTISLLEFDLGDCDIDFIEVGKRTASEVALQDISARTTVLESDMDSGTGRMAQYATTVWVTSAGYQTVSQVATQISTFDTTYAVSATLTSLSANGTISKANSASTWVDGAEANITSIIASYNTDNNIPGEADITLIQDRLDAAEGSISTQIVSLSGAELTLQEQGQEALLAAYNDFLLANSAQLVEARMAYAETSLQALATSTAATAEQVVSLGAQMEGAFANVSVLNRAVANVDQASASRDLRLEATIAESSATSREYTNTSVGYCVDAQGNPTSHANAVLCTSSGHTWVEGPLAEYIRELTVYKDGQAASISDIRSVFETINNVLVARGSMISNVNGNLVGWMSQNDGTQSDFNIIADHFSVGMVENDVFNKYFYLDLTATPPILVFKGRAEFGDYVVNDVNDIKTPRVTLRGSAFVFSVAPDNTNPDPAFITLTVDTDNVSSVQWSTTAGVLEGSGNSRTLSHASLGSSLSATVTVNGLDGASNIVATDTFTVQSVSDGEDGVSGSYISYIFRNAATVPATPTGGTYDGVNETYPTDWADDPTSPTFGQVTWVSKATYSYDGTAWNSTGWSTPSQFSGVDGVDGSYRSYIFRNDDQNTIPATPTGGSYNGVTEVIPTFWTDDPASPAAGQYTFVSTTVYSYNGSGWTNSGWSTPARFSGTDGFAGKFTSYIFRNAATAPATPTGGSYDGSTEVIPTGWNDDPSTPAAGERIWVSKTVYEYNGSGWVGSGWGAPAQLSGEDGLDGTTGAYTSYIFRNAATAPATPTGGSYDGSIEVIPTGWSDDPSTPAAGLFTWVATAIYSTTDGVAWTHTGWSSPAQFSGPPGEDGLDGKFTSYIFRNHPTPPTTPTGGSYDGSIEVVPNNWADDPSTPAAGSFTWMSKTVYSYNGSTWVGSGWSAPSQFSGEDGIDGSFTSYIFRNAATAPATPTGGSYNGSTEVIPTGWSDDPSTPAKGEYSWISKTVYRYDNGSWVKTAWAPPSKFSGEDGFDGTFTSYIYASSVSAPATPTGGSYNGSTEVIPTGWNATVPTTGLGESVWVSSTKYSYDGSWTHGSWATPKVFVEAPTVVGYLTNETQQVDTDSNGTVLSYSGLGGEFKVLQGSTEVPDAYLTFSYVGNNLTLNLDTNTGIFTVTSLTSTSGSATITAVYTPGGSKVYTLVKVYTLSKAIPGATGATGATGARGSKFLTLTLRDGVFPSDSLANADMLQAYGLTPVLGDVLTYRNLAGTVSETKEYDGNSWEAPSMLIDGSLVATGTISGDRLVAGTSIEGPILTAASIDTVKLIAHGTFDPTGGGVAAVTAIATTATSGTVAMGVQGSASGATTNIGVQGVTVTGPGGTSVGVDGAGNYGIGVRGSCLVDPSGFDFYAAGAGINYGPFTGGHEGVVPSTFTAEPGDIVCDVELFAIKNTSNAITKMRLSTAPQDRAVRGIYTATTIKGYLPAAATNIPEDCRVIVFNAVGEGTMNVCGMGGSLEVGDFICSSSVPGKGMRQDDQTVERPYTIAQARHSVTFSTPREVQQVAVIYLRG